MTLASTCRRLADLDSSPRNSTRRRRDLHALARATLDGYQERWDRRLMPFLHELGLQGQTPQEALPCYWAQGWQAVALDLAQRNLDEAIRADACRLQDGRRSRSGLTTSWVAENIAIGWRGAYLSALLRWLNEDSERRGQDEPVSWSQLNGAWRAWSRARRDGDPISAARALTP